MTPESLWVVGDYLRLYVVLVPPSMITTSGNEILRCYGVGESPVNWVRLRLSTYPVLSSKVGKRDRVVPETRNVIGKRKHQERNVDVYRLKIEKLVNVTFPQVINRDLW